MMAGAPWVETKGELSVRTDPFSTPEAQQRYREEMARQALERERAENPEDQEAPPETSPKPLDPKFSDLRERQEAKKLTPDPPSSNGETLKSPTFNQASFTEIARACGVTPTQISYVMRGIRNPSVRLLREMARSLGMTMDELDERLQKVRKLRENGNFWPG